MAGKKDSMIDSDFIEDGDDDVRSEERWTPPEPQEVNPPKRSKDSNVEVEITDDDVPETDRNKWVADDERDGEPDIPGEEEVRGYAKDVQKRIGNMTARIHAERRRADGVAREHQEAVNLAQRLLSENNQLKGVIEQGEKVLMGEHRGRLQGAIDQAKIAYREAHEAGDAAGMIAAQENLAKAVAQMERAAGYRPMQMQREDDTILRAPPQQEQGQVDPEAAKWAEKNKWFGRDDAMTGYALGFHKHLIEREGITPDQPDYYKKLNAEMRRRFPDRFRGSLPERRSAAPVGAVSRTGNASARTVRITESQAKLARRLGLTVEQYAQQIVAEQDNRDGRNSFTHT